MVPLIAAGAPFGTAHYAAGAGQVTFVRALLEAGADANADLGTDSGSPTALHRAASGGHVDCIRALLAAGAHTEAISWIDIWTPLHSADVAGQAACMEALLAAGADPNALDRNLFSPLHLVFRYCKDANVKLACQRMLLAAGAEVPPGLHLATDEAEACPGPLPPLELPVLPPSCMPSEKPLPMCHPTHSTASFSVRL